MTTLTEFLLARIAEDEAVVDTEPDFIEDVDSARSPGWGNRGECPICGHFMFDGNEVVTAEAWWDHVETYHKRTRALAECEAKRQIVEAWTRLEAGDTTQWVITGVWDEGLGYAVSALEFALGCLAAVYADHPDFDPEWAV